MKSFIRDLSHLQRDLTRELDDQAAMEICSKISELKSPQAAVLVTAGRCIVTAFRRGRVTDLEVVRQMLNTLVPILNDTRNIYVTRAVRMASFLPWSSDSEILIAEASRPNRISSYSAMDLSELIHSLHKWKTVVSDEHALLSIDRLFTVLLSELSSRQHLLRVKNQIVSNSRLRPQHGQDLSFIAVSNILFAIRTMGPSISRSILRDVLKSTELTEDDAYRGATILHLVSVCDSLLLTGSADSQQCDWKVYRRILKELKRKQSFAGDENPFVSACVMKLMTQYSNKKLLIGFIH
jgi:hypothetical protein